MTKEKKEKTKKVRETQDSFAIEHVEYYVNKELLLLYMRDNSVLEYSGVPRSIYDGLMGADSKGRYFNFNIRNNFKYTRRG